MSVINADRKYCYRIIHIQNLSYILEQGMVSKQHPQANAAYIQIGNPEIIDVRSNTAVRIEGYGDIGEYVPFYFTPRSMMLYNIVTGYRSPLVPKRNREEIVVIRCLIEQLATLDHWFFTNGQGNDFISKHFHDLDKLSEIDWESIQQSNFSKSDGDFDRPRRYQAEFLVRHVVPLSHIESLHVYNETAKATVEKMLEAKKILNFGVQITPTYFF